MNKYKTPKLFFSKYPYKLVVKTVFSNSFRGNDLIYIRELLDRYFSHLAEGNPMYLHVWRDKVRISAIEVVEAQKIYTELSKNKEYKLRIENQCITVYSKDRDWLYNLGCALDPAAYEWWEPQNNLEPNILIMSSKMKDWGYKITLGINVPQEFYSWAVTNSDKLKIGSKLLAMLRSHRKQSLNGYYFYVRNDKMLNLVNLVIGSGIQRIDKIVVDDRSA